MRDHVAQWFQSRTSSRSDWTLAELQSAKGETTISVVLPALNEEPTVGAIVESIRRDLMDLDHPLIDELVVVDSGSSDATAVVAAAAGARVEHRTRIGPAGLSSASGKGEAMWRSLFATSGDVVVFLDADVSDFSTSFVTGLLGPLLTDESVSFVKGYYDRPESRGNGGGRVTELVARPLLDLHWPDLAGVIQPLAGEYAARRTLLEQLPFPCGYGVELGLLVDTLAVAGLDGIAQVDLGVRSHRHQDLAALGRMAAEIWQTALDRLDRDGRIVLVEEPTPTLVQFSREGSTSKMTGHDVTLHQRPPAKTFRTAPQSNPA